MAIRAPTTKKSVAVGHMRKAGRNFQEPINGDGKDEKMKAPGRPMEIFVSCRGCA